MVLHFNSRLTASLEYLMYLLFVRFTHVVENAVSDNIAVCFQRGRAWRTSRQLVSTARLSSSAAVELCVLTHVDACRMVVPGTFWAVLQEYTMCAWIGCVPVCCSLRVHDCVRYGTDCAERFCTTLQCVRRVAVEVKRPHVNTFSCMLLTDSLGVFKQINYDCI